MSAELLSGIANVPSDTREWSEGVYRLKQGDLTMTVLIRAQGCEVAEPVGMTMLQRDSFGSSYWWKRLDDEAARAVTERGLVKGGDAT